MKQGNKTFVGFGTVDNSNNTITNIPQNVVGTIASSLFYEELLMEDCGINLLYFNGTDNPSLKSYKAA